MYHLMLFSKMSVLSSPKTLHSGVIPLSCMNLAQAPNFTGH